MECGLGSVFIPTFVITYQALFRVSFIIYLLLCKQYYLIGVVSRGIDFIAHIIVDKFARIHIHSFMRVDFSQPSFSNHY